MALERTLRIKKGNDALGIVECPAEVLDGSALLIVPSLPVIRRISIVGLTLELAERGANGMLVKGINPGGAVALDGRVEVGDYLVAINNESLRNVTNSQVRAIIRRAQLLTDEMM